MFRMFRLNTSKIRHQKQPACFFYWWILKVCVHCEMIRQLNSINVTCSSINVTCSSIVGGFLGEFVKWFLTEFKQFYMFFYWYSKHCSRRRAQEIGKQKQIGKTETKRNRNRTETKTRSKKQNRLEKQKRNRLLGKQKQKQKHRQEAETDL